MILAHLSDPHIVAYGKLLRGPIQGAAADAVRLRREFDTAKYLARAVTAINALVPKPDITVVTGDLVDNGERAEYEHLRALLAPLSMPVFVIPGNHDARESLRQTFDNEGYLPTTGELHYAVNDYPLRLIALDTLVDGKHYGSLSRNQLTWLDVTLAEQPDRPTAIMMHHPPFSTGITSMDSAGLDNARALADVVGSHRQIERILCGHLHRAIDRRFAGTIAGTAPGTAHQIRINLVPGTPLSFNFEPPGYQLHVWQDGGLVTHTALFGEWLDPVT